MDIYLATGNAHKLEEMQSFVSSRKLDIKIYSASELGGMPDHEENGSSFEANAMIKAKALQSVAPVDAWILADDSGLCVDALEGAPGIYSSRFAGEDAKDEDNTNKLLQVLTGLEKAERTAHFVCVLVLLAGGKEHIFRAECPGHLLESCSGKKGFGYDPIFVPDGERKTFAKLGDKTKNKISHRARALELLSQWLEK